jgi:cysteine synthase A
VQYPIAVTEHFRALNAMVGNTPLLAINFRRAACCYTVYAKAEFLNLTGSIKDRMALHVLQSAYRSGEIKSGDTIVEATSGNTGIALAAVGRALGHPVVIFMPDWMSPERAALIRSFGACVEPVSKEQGGFLGSIALSASLARERDDVFLPRQFSNAANVEAHRLTTGPEIAFQLSRVNRSVNAFVAGVGTGGTVMGVGNYLRSQDPTVRVHPLEPAESPTLSTGTKTGKHRIQGISDEFVPPICDLKSLDEVMAIPDGDAILMAQKLAASLGLGVGISSGANFLGAVRALGRYGERAIIATVFPDDNKKYLSTDLIRDEPIKSGYLSSEIELLSYEALPRTVL